MATKYLRIGFYQVVVTHQPVTEFDAVLKSCDSLPDDENRALPDPHQPIRLQRLHRSKRVWEGDMMRIRLDEELQRAKMNGRIRPVDFEEDEGLGENTAFLYDPHTNILAVHENRGGVPVSAFGRYFKVLGSVRRIDLRPVIRPQAIERIEKMKRPTELQLRFAGITHGGGMQRRGRAAKRIFELLEFFRAPNAAIKLSMGKKPGGLTNIADGIRDVLASFRDDEREQIRKVLVIGSEGEDGERAVIDLFQDRLVEQIPVEIGDGHKLSDADRFHAVRVAWDTHSKDLERHYGHVAAGRA